MDSATTGKEAIVCTREHKPAIVLMDIELMGSVNGLEATQQICAFSTAKFLFITGYQEAGLQGQAMVLTPIAYLIKPIEINDIDHLIRESHSQ